MPFLNYLELERPILRDSGLFLEDFGPVLGPFEAI